MTSAQNFNWDMLIFTVLTISGVIFVLYFIIESFHYIINKCNNKKILPIAEVVHTDTYINTEYAIAIDE
jgi:hypothetical protein